MRQAPDSKFHIPDSDFIRLPAVAGSFYPAGAENLSGQISGFLEKAKTEEAMGKVRLLVVPHAGYEYSGQVAAYGYRQLAGGNYKTAVIVGPSHHAFFAGFSVFPAGSYRTPLGDAEIDGALAEKIMAADPQLISFCGEAHAKEHSVEVQVPFLQSVLPDLKIIPIVAGDVSAADCRRLAGILAEVLPGDSIVIASSDLSHYPPYEAAVYADKKTVGAILSGSVEKLEETIGGLMGEGLENLHTCLCGEGAVKTIMFLAEEMEIRNIRLLKYANSGDVIGDMSQVVGYAAIVFCE